MNGSMGAVLGNHVVSLYDRIDKQDREDIFDCLLHAEQFASQHFDSSVDYCNWWFRYRTRLEARGWRLVDPIKHTPQVVFTAADLKAVTFNIIATAGNRELANLALASWQSLKGNRYADRFLRQGSDNGELMRFQIVPCEIDSNTCTQMMLCAVRLTGSVEIRDFDFWTETRREMLLRISGGVYRFDPTVYANYRDGIREQLLKSSDYAIQQFPI